MGKFQNCGRFKLELSCIRSGIISGKFQNGKPAKGERQSGVKGEWKNLSKVEWETFQRQTQFGLKCYTRTINLAGRNLKLQKKCRIFPRKLSLEREKLPRKETFLVIFYRLQRRLITLSH